MQKINLDTDFVSFTIVKSKWITDLNVNYKSVKVLEDNIGNNLDNPHYVTV